MTGCPLLDSEYAARQNGKRLPCERLAEENERLRELVRHMLVCIDHMARGFSDGDMRCYECQYDNDEQRCDFEQRARELGVEV